MNIKCNTALATKNDSVIFRWNLDEMVMYFVDIDRIQKYISPCRIAI